MKAAEDLAELARAFTRIVERIAERDAPEADGDWVDQHESPLGVRLHCRAVRRRKAEGKGGASEKNRVFKLTREALLEEMERSPKPGLRKTTGRTETRSSVAKETAARLRLLRKPPKE